LATETYLMALEGERIEVPDDDVLVPVVFARSEEEAERYRQILEDHDIEVVVGLEEAEGRVHEEMANASRGQPVLVPENLLDEAEEIIAHLEDPEGFADEEEDEQKNEDDLDLHPEVSPEEMDKDGGPDGLLEDDLFADDSLEEDLDNEDDYL
jgi:hypothetical protein